MVSSLGFLVYSLDTEPDHNKVWLIAIAPQAIFFLCIGNPQPVQAYHPIALLRNAPGADRREQN